MAAVADRTESLPSAIVDIDNAVERWVAGRRSGRLDDAAHLVSSAADQAKITVALSMLRWIVDRRNGRRAAARTVVGVLATTAAVDIVKKRVNRPRPVNDVVLRYRVRPQTSASFPSGHAVSAAMLVVSLGDQRRSWRRPLTLLAAAIAWSRIQVGLHHTSDVIGGLAIGTVAGIVVRRIVPLRKGPSPD